MCGVYLSQDYKKTYYFMRLTKILFYYISLFFSAVFLSYLLFISWGPDPTQLLLGLSYTETQELELANKLGLKNSFWWHLKIYFTEIIHFNFAESFYKERAVTSLVSEALPISFWVGLPAFFLSEVLALILAVFYSINNSSLPFNSYHEYWCSLLCDFASF